MNKEDNADKKGDPGDVRQQRPQGPYIVADRAIVTRAMMMNMDDRIGAGSQDKSQQEERENGCQNPSIPMIRKMSDSYSLPLTPPSISNESGGNNGFDDRLPNRVLFNDRLHDSIIMKSSQPGSKTDTGVKCSGQTPVKCRRDPGTTPFRQGICHTLLTMQRKLLY